MYENPRRIKIPLDTEIEGDFPAGQLPYPPKNYEWKLEKRRRYRTRKYRRKIPVIKYTYVDDTDRPYYRTIKGKRKKFYRKYRVYYEDYETQVFRRREYYDELWWRLARKKKKKVSEQWVETRQYLDEVFDDTDEEVEIEEEPPFDYIERRTQFNARYKRLTWQRFDLIFLYYIISIYTSKDADEDDRAYILTSSSAYLGGLFSIEEITRDILPKALDNIIDNMKHSTSDVHFVKFVAWSAVTKRALEAGREA